MKITLKTILKTTSLYSFLTALLLIFISNFSFGQAAPKDSLWQTTPKVEFSAYLDIFYAFDFQQPTSATRQPFLYNHNRHNELNLNNGIAKVALTHPKYRANIAFHAGTYVNDNYANEPLSLKFINEANIGLSLNKKNNLWLDAGVLPSYIGFESAVSMDNQTLTRSILAENSPYFMTGARLSYQANAKFSAAILICNGWQRIARLAANSLPSFGSQISYTPSSNLAINWSTFVGTDSPDSARLMRYFSNLYLQGTPNQKLKYTLGFDFGAQQTQQQAQPNSQNMSLWLSPVAIVSYQFAPKYTAALRAEYYHDPNNAITQPNNQQPLSCFSASFNLDYRPTTNIACRLEARYFQNQDPIFFQKNNQLTNHNFILVASIAAKLQP